MASKIFPLMSPAVLAAEAESRLATASRVLRFRAVFEAPRELSLRLVLADWLLEQGDPHGEFIALQFDPSRKARMRAAKLLRRHRTAFLGPLWPFVVDSADEQWHHGFVSHAAVQLEMGLFDEPSLATLDSMRIVWGDTRVLKSKWLRATTSHAWPDDHAVRRGAVRGPPASPVLMTPRGSINTISTSSAE